ncbi:MAG TPA: YIP1 family protein [Gaiellaceae bacterium]|nr:YIP1 family protein [Gaiellaceae bacterium]
MSARSEPGVETLEREWWARLPRLLTAPAEVFRRLADESRAAADERQEPLVAVTFLAGIPMFLSLVSLQPPYDRYTSFSELDLVLQTIIGAGLVGLSNFWLGGFLVYLGARGLGALTGFRLGRHLAGLATAPFVVELVLVWPVRLALYGGDLFRSGGADEGTGGDVFRGIDALFLLWAVVLVLVGIRSTQRWTWRRSGAAVGVAALFAVLVGTFVFAVSR